MAKKSTKKANKTEFIEKLSVVLGTSKLQSEKILGSVLDTIMDYVVKDYTLNLTGFGSFYKAERKERQGINPKTKGKMLIKASKSAGFRAGNKFKAAVRAEKEKPTKSKSK